MINILFDTILPGDKELGLPSGSSIDIIQYISYYGIEKSVDEYLHFLNDLSLDKFNLQFVQLEAVLRLEIVELSKRKNNRLANTIILHCLKAYYSDTNVLNSLPSGAVPPFPAGNFLEEDDWSLLNQVYERGPVYRSVLS